MQLFTREQLVDFVPRDSGRGSEVALDGALPLSLEARARSGASGAVGLAEHT